MSRSCSALLRAAILAALSHPLSWTSFTTAHAQDAQVPLRIDCATVEEARRYYTGGTFRWRSAIPNSDQEIQFSMVDDEGKVFLSVKRKYLASGDPSPNYILTLNTPTGVILYEFDRIEDIEQHTDHDTSTHKVLTREMNFVQSRFNNGLYVWIELRSPASIPTERFSIHNIVARNVVVACQ